MPETARPSQGACRKLRPMTPPVRVELIAVDLDGTLLDADREVSRRSAESSSRAKAAGVAVVLASGRNLPAVGHFAGDLGLDDPMICANGAHVVRNERSELSHVPVSGSVALEVIAYAAAERIHLNLYSKSRLCFFANSAWGDEYARRVRFVIPEVVPVSEMARLEATKLMLVDDPDSIVRHQTILSSRLSSRVEIVSSEAEYLEFLAPGVHKGHGLSIVAGALGLARNETAAIGDYYNDLEMLRWAGISAAVANAPPEIRDAADLIVASNRDGGVAEFIDHLLSNR